MCDSCIQPPKDPTYHLMMNPKYDSIYKFLNERNERLARQEEIDRMEKELHEYYGYLNGESHQTESPISRDQLIARIQQFQDMLFSINSDLKDANESNQMVEFLLEKHSMLFEEILSEFSL